VGRPEHGRRTWQAQPAGEMEGRNVEVKKKNKNEKEQK
jgi:hypothetical protein